MARLAGLLFACLGALALGTQTPGTDSAGAASAEVVVALTGPPLAHAPTSGAQLAAEQRAFRSALVDQLPDARVRWRYRLVVNGFAVSVPQSQLDALRHVPGVREVYETGSYEPQLDRSPGQIGAPGLWGPGLDTAGQGLKIGIIDTGVDASHPFFDPAGYVMPDGFPKGQRQFTSAKVIVARAFAPRVTDVAGAELAFDGEASSHGTHVAGIAAGNAETRTSGGRIVSGVAPRAYIGNYKVFTRSASDGGPIENAAELVAAIEAAVRDGMDVINLSLGEPEINPRRNIVTLALDAAAAAGVVPVVAAGNEYNDVGAGSVSSPATAARAIAVGAVEVSGTPSRAVHADFSSVGPAPISLRLKPDVAAPGVDILSSVPGGGWSSSSGTSMASPHVAGAAALLLQRHPTWTVEDVRSALVQSGANVTDDQDVSLGPQFQGGGLVVLARADRPLLFAQPTTLSFGLLERRGSARKASVLLRDADGGAGTWSATVEYVRRPAGTSVALAASEVSVPGRLGVEARVGASPQAGDITGYLVLRRASAVRRIPFWGYVVAPRLAEHRALSLQGPGTYSGTTRGRPGLVASYRYPDDPRAIGVTTVLRGPENVYRVRIRGRVANFGVVMTRRSKGARVEPRVVASQDESRLTGIAGLPIARNPYLERGFYTAVLSAGALSPALGDYSVVFDSAARANAGSFTFRLWVDDVTPPTLRFGSRTVRRGTALSVAASDSGAGVSPDHVFASIDGRTARATYTRGTVRIPTSGLAPGVHRLRLQVSDYQELKNTENVARILPNTRILTTTFRVVSP